ncbi:MAG: 1-deoxy-D-xylulose-5-phosphate reductoisomerase [Chloroflexi bacterium]|nr:1-deoxy-D-xylulose-5-phosphate reductoisomerase [Chloroflexota bacterium]|tara:strand:- start:18439 stop:19578 length:1140 start_codon:yes stop_codon:yes gene_type:complete
MVLKRKGIVLLGSTGSIGTQTLDVIRVFSDHFKVIGLVAGKNKNLLKSQIKEFNPKFAYCDQIESYDQLFDGTDSIYSDIETMITDSEVDLLVSATSGDVSILHTMSAINSGVSIALANKETIVMLGDILMDSVKSNKVNLFPIDSEPNAIWQCIRGEDNNISKLIITASGGSVRSTSLKEMKNLTPDQVLKHPNWNMGDKITVDSATMMNKVFEVIEAHWLFDVPWEKIDVVVHPESMIHSLVEFDDGSIKAQISNPDMRLPIQYALMYPNRKNNKNIKRFDPISTGALNFIDIDYERYPCFKLGLNAAMKGGTWPAALSGADDIAVESFLKGKISFLEISSFISEILSSHNNILNPNIDQILDAANSARDRGDLLIR